MGSCDGSNRGRLDVVLLSRRVVKVFAIFITITTFRALNAYTSVVERCSHLGSIELIVIINILDFCDAQRPFQAALDVCSPRGRKVW